MFALVVAVDVDDVMGVPLFTTRTCVDVGAGAAVAVAIGVVGSCVCWTGASGGGCVLVVVAAVVAGCVNGGVSGRLFSPAGVDGCTAK